MNPQRVVITGGASSVGLATAERFLALGQKVHICDIDQDLLRRTLSSHPNLHGTVADVGNVSSVRRLFEDVYSWMDGVDVLVNNVGIGGPKAFLEDIEHEQWVETINANLNGIFYTTRHVLRGMKERTHGVIINISSASTRTGLPMRIPYVASKAGVEALTRTLARELGPYNIRCNAIRPGMINNQRARSIIKRKAEADHVPESAVLENYLRFISMRTMVQPEEIADVIVFLSSKEARHITGQIIGVDGNLEWEE